MNSDSKRGTATRQNSIQSGERITSSRMSAGGKVSMGRVLDGSEVALSVKVLA